MTLVILLIPAFLIGFGLTFFSDRFTDPLPENSLVLTDWLYSYDMAEATANWQNTEQAWGKLPGREGRQDLWLVTTVPDTLMAHAVLILHRPILDIEVFIEENQIYSSGGADRNYRPAGTANLAIPVTAGSRLMLHFVSTLPFIGLPEPPIITSYQAHIRNILLSELDELLIVASLVILALGSLVIALFIPYRQLAVIFAGAAALSALYIVSQMTSKDLLSTATLPWLIIWLVTLFALPYSFLALCRKIFDDGLLKWFHPILLITGLLGLLLVFLYTINFNQNSATQIFKILFVYRLAFQLMVLLTGLICLVAAFRSLRRSQDSNLLFYAYGIAAFFGACSAQIIVALGSGAYGARGNIHLGFALFLFSCFSILVRRLLEQKHCYSKALGSLETYEAALRHTINQPLLIMNSSGSVLYYNEVFSSLYIQVELLDQLDNQSTILSLCSDITTIQPLKVQTRDGAFHRREAVCIPLHDQQNTCALVICNPENTDILKNWPELSSRERELVKLASYGLSNQEMADRMGITVRTVKAHCTSIFTKLNIQSRKELMARLLASTTQSAICDQPALQSTGSIGSAATKKPALLKKSQACD